MPWHMCGTCESWFSTSSVYIVGMDFGLSGFLVSTSTHPLSHVSGMCMHACMLIYLQPGFWRWNSGPHACVVDNLLTDFG